MKYLVMLAVFGLTACGDKNLTKPFYGEWTQEGSAAKLDLSAGANSNPFQSRITFPNGAQCTCTSAVSRDATYQLQEPMFAGQISYSNCAYVPATGPGNPGCASLQGSQRYDYRVQYLIVGNAAYHQ